MKPTGEKFELDFVGQKVAIEVYTSQGLKVYLAIFKKDEPLFLTKALNAQGNEWWTSVPEGRLELARAIGALIDERGEDTPSIPDLPKQTTLF